MEIGLGWQGLKGSANPENCDFASGSNDRDDGMWGRYADLAWAEREERRVAG
jgi:hypothetical protein